jgi:uncharacterized OB-fold protein
MLTFHQCAKCGTLDAACINTCAKCLASEMNPVQIAGVGKLVSWTTVRKPPLRFKADGMYYVGVFDQYFVFQRFSFHRNPSSAKYERSPNIFLEQYSFDYI